MVKISSARNLQYKLVKNIVLSILIPATIILFSAWFFFGDMWGKPAATKTDPTDAMKMDATETTKADEKPTDSCKGMTQDKCNLDTCMWDPTQNMCFANK